MESCRERFLDLWMFDTMIVQKLKRNFDRCHTDRFRLVSGDVDSTWPRVSVIIPTYNRSALLSLTVESVLAQTYPRIEVIVVDDGSTDDTAEVMAQHAGRVTYIRQTNQGVAAARNRGIQAASGECLTCLDDDDLLLPTKIERQVQVLASRPRVGMVHCRFYYADEDGNHLYKIGFLPEGQVLEKLVCKNFIWSGAPLIPRRCLDQVGLFDEQVPSIVADWDMWLRIAQAGYPFACVQEPLGTYRVHRDSMMSDVAELERGVFAILERVFSNPDVPVEVMTLKRQVFGESRFWMSCRYYAAGQWENARRNLSEALTLCPHLRAQPGVLVRLLANDALSARVDEPFQFVANVFDHLPPCAEGLRQHRSHLLSRICLGLAMRRYSAGDIAQAKSLLAQAIALAPAPFEQENDFVRLLSYYAAHLPDGVPLLYVDTVLQNLPPQAERLKCVRARVLGNVNVRLAYQDYLTGQHQSAIIRILNAWRHHPFSISRRHVASVFLRSLLGFGYGLFARVSGRLVYARSTFGGMGQE